MSLVAICLVGLVLVGAFLIIELLLDLRRIAREADDEIDVVIGEGFTPHPRPFPGEADIERQIDAIIREAQDA